MTAAKRVPYVIFVEWGGMKVTFGVTKFGLMEYPGQIAMSAAHALAKLMIEFPDREGSRPFLPIDGVEYRLKIKGADDALNPMVMMHRAFAGQWKMLDQEALDRLGFEQLTEELRHGESYIELELVETHASNPHNN